MRDPHSESISEAGGFRVSRTPCSKLYVSDGLSRRRGFTLVEAVIALLIAGAGSLAFMAASIHSSREVAKNRDRLYGVQLASTVAARVAGCDFKQLGDPTATGYAAQFNSPQTAPSTILPVGDPLAPMKPADITYQFAGWGTASAVVPALATTLPATHAPGARAWVPNEWVGHYVVIAAGRGSGQIMKITANTANVLTVTSRFDGTVGTGWSKDLDTSSIFYIDNSKYAFITVTWNKAVTSGPTANSTQVNNSAPITRVVAVPRPQGVS